MACLQGASSGASRGVDSVEGSSQLLLLSGGSGSGRDHSQSIELVEAAAHPHEACLRKLARQLDRFGPGDILLGRFELLGPRERLQGGAPLPAQCMAFPCGSSRAFTQQPVALLRSTSWLARPFMHGTVDTRMDARFQQVCEWTSHAWVSSSAVNSSAHCPLFIRSPAALYSD